jgi:flagellar motor protein MotB
MSTISYGDTLPIEANKTAKGRSKNRRVVIVVLE